MMLREDKLDYAWKRLFHFHKLPGKAARAQKCRRLCFWQPVILLKDLVEENKQTNKLRKVILGGRDGELKSKVVKSQRKVAKLQQKNGENIIVNIPNRGEFLKVWLSEEN